MNEDDLAAEIRRETVDRVIMTGTAGPGGSLTHSEDTGICLTIPQQDTRGWHTLPAEGDEVEVIINIRRKSQQEG